MLRGKNGIAVVQMLRVESLGANEEYLLAAASADNEVLDAEVTEKLLALPGKAADISSSHAPPQQAPLMPELAAEQTALDFETAHIAVPDAVRQALEQQRAAVIGNIERRNLGLFSEESEKLDAWADDLKIALEQEIKELDRRIKETRMKSKGAATLAEKLEAQKVQRELEAQRDKKRRELFARQDEIQGRRDQLIAELEQQLRQQVSLHGVLCCEWELS